MASGVVDLEWFSMRESLRLSQSLAVTVNEKGGEKTIGSWMAILKRAMTSMVHIAKGV